MSRVAHWPLFGLRVHTPMLELRYLTDDDIAEIASRASDGGIHDPVEMPFGVAWTDAPSPQLERNTMQYHWGQRASWQPHDWGCDLGVFVDGRLVGVQGMVATDFARLRQATTGSFLFRAHQGRGIGTEMRSAVLHLLFDGLGAEVAQTGAWADNASSLGVTRKLGYEPEGARRMLSRGRPRIMRGFRMSRQQWRTQRRDDIVVEGLEPCLEMFGAPRLLGCAGIDGCRAGWVMATRDGVRVVERLADALAEARHVVGIDMPIGLPQGDGREADLAARRFLSPRGSTIFPTPPRACLDATDYLDACDRSAALTGKRLTKQTWNIVAKMREVDRAVSASDEERVVEVHPECSFTLMHGAPLHSKHTPEGIAQRVALVTAEFGDVPRRLPGASLDDILDAYAVLWSAERFARDEHRTFAGDHPERDERGLLMRIVA